jgi:hypothetical protein
VRGCEGARVRGCVKQRARERGRMGREARGRAMRRRSAGGGRGGRGCVSRASQKGVLAVLALAASHGAVLPSHCQAQPVAGCELC